MHAARWDIRCCQLSTSANITSLKLTIPYSHALSAYCEEALRITGNFRGTKCFISHDIFVSGHKRNNQPDKVLRRPAIQSVIAVSSDNLLYPRNQPSYTFYLSICVRDTALLQYIYDVQYWNYMCLYIIAIVMILLNIDKVYYYRPYPLSRKFHPTG